MYECRIDDKILFDLHRVDVLLVLQELSVSTVNNNFLFCRKANT